MRPKVNPSAIAAGHDHRGHAPSAIQAQRLRMTPNTDRVGRLSRGAAGISVRDTDRQPRDTEADARDTWHAISPVQTGHSAAPVALRWAGAAARPSPQAGLRRPAD